VPEPTPEEPVPEMDFTLTWTGNMPVTAWTAMIFGLGLAYPDAAWVLSSTAGYSIRLGEPADLSEGFWDRLGQEQD
jgi:hypothetical protein